MPEGSPELKYGGFEPTGELPDAVNFPLAEAPATANPEQNCVMGGDIQPYNIDEVGYARNGAFADLYEREDYASCGVLFLGDIVGDDLSLFDDIRDLTAGLNGPARFLPGNHDLDFDAPTEEHKFDTFRSEFGPTYYSYDVGEAHIVVLDSVRYPVGGDSTYSGGLGEEQLEWLRQDIANTPDDKLIVVATHIGLLSFIDSAWSDHQIAEAPEVHNIIGDRKAISVAGHVHALSNIREGDSMQGWKDLFGIEEAPFQHIVSGAISGGWYAGSVGEEGYPPAIARDGSRPGVLTLDLNGTDYREFYTASGKDQDGQMSVGLNSPAYRAWFEENQDNEGAAQPLEDALTVSQDDLGETWLTSNFWIGGTGDVVEVSIDDEAPIEAQRTQQLRGEEVLQGVEYSDPAAVQYQLVHGGGPALCSSSLYTADLPTDLAAGEHTAVFTATDVYGKVYTEELTFTVTEPETEVTETPAAPEPSAVSSSAGELLGGLVNLLKQILGFFSLNN